MSTSPSFAFSKHRLEGLTDGIFAVTMTLLVIELKIPESAHVNSQAALMHAVADLTPKIIAWIISFFALAQFWYANHRLFHFVRHIDGKFTFLVLVYLSLVSLVPFSSALVGEYQIIFFSQVFYSINLGCLAIMSLLITRHALKHPEISGIAGMPLAIYRGARLRNIGLLFVAVISIVIAYYAAGFGNSAFALMAVFSPLSRRLEARELAQTSSQHTPVARSVTTQEDANV